MVSFDIVSLFTNIPLEECIDLAVKYISDGNPDITLSNTKLKSLFSVATAQTHFLFKGSFYDQIDGVAMGSPSLLFFLIYLWVIMKNYGWKISRTLRYCFTDVMLMIHFVYFIRRIKRYYFSTTLTPGTLTSDSLWKRKQIIRYLS